MSNPVAGVFRRVAQRLGAVLQKATGTIVERSYRPTVDGLQDAATGMARGDRDGAIQIGRASYRFGGPRLHGIDDFDRGRVSFRPRHVFSAQMNDASGKPIGVIFPSDSTNVGLLREWASALIRRGDREYVSGKDEVPTRAPWAHDTEAGRPPTYIASHGENGKYSVLMRKGNGPVITVGLDGTNFGKLVAADRHFKRAAELAHSHNPKVGITCMSGHPDGTAARSMADELHRSGVVKGDIYAPVGDIYTDVPDNSDGSESSLGVYDELDGDGNRMPDFSKYPGPVESPIA